MRILIWHELGDVLPVSSIDNRVLVKMVHSGEIRS